MSESKDDADVDWGRQPTAVYVRDKQYAWLPARLVKPVAEGDDTATVELSLPPDWSTHTSDPSHPTLAPGEDGRGAIRTVKLSDYPGNDLPLQNVGEDGKLQGKSDMADLPFLHEAAILYNLKERHANGVPYTRVGDIVVAMNPFKWIDGLYSEEKQAFYSHNLLWKPAKVEEGEVTSPKGDAGRKKTTPDLGGTTVHTYTSEYDKLGYAPHVYETSCLSYRGVATDRQNQTILVSGESGAGKTETVKIVMTHLATVEQTRPGEVASGADAHVELSPIVKRVLESNPVFEAFGNAKTVRNDNSSRFGRFTQLQFDVEDASKAEAACREVPMCRLAGSSCVTYLLEKSRVVGHVEGERTYHIFYQLLAAPVKYRAGIWEEGLAKATTESFKYIGHSDVNSIEGMSDEECWAETLAALAIFGVQGEELKTLLRALCVVLQLGNLSFEANPASEFEDSSVVASREELEKLSALMGVSTSEIETSLTKRFMVTRGEALTKTLRPEHAKEGCDAFAKEVYARVFEMLVRKINDDTDASKHYDKERASQFGIISLLDIFGFENFNVNRFEQLCINYANERLQNQYVLDNFRAVQEEYLEEGIELFDLSLVDNSDVLNLLDSKLGLIVALNEECIRPKGSDESFVYKLKIVHEDSNRLINERLHLPTQFGVKHFAGDVTYNANAFIQRNTDKLPNDLLELGCLSTNQLIHDEFESLTAAVKAFKVGIRKRSAQTVLTKFRTQLSQLMSSIETTRTRYIRCIKPNTMKSPQITDHQSTMKQLESAGLVTAIVISRETFPNRLKYAVVLERFRVLVSEDEVAKHSDIKVEVENILTKLLPMEKRGGQMMMPFACGKTKVYFRTGALERLETERMDYYEKRVLILQRWARRIIHQWRYATVRKGVIQLQARCRGRAETRLYKRKKLAAVVLQCASRQRRARALLVERRQNYSATQIQKIWRGKKPSENLERFRAAARCIQLTVKKKKNQTNFSSKLAICVEEARMDHKLSLLQESVSAKISDAKGGSTSVDEKFLQDAGQLFSYLREEIYSLRVKNSDLKTQVRKTDEAKREKDTRDQNAQVASTMSKIRINELAKANTALIGELMAHKAQLAVMKKEVKRLDADHVSEKEKIAQQHVEEMKQQKVETEMAKKEVREMKAAHKIETDILTDEMEKTKEDSFNEIMKLKQELKQTQDSHHDYLTKLMDVLESTHAAREEESARVAKELEEIKRTKDAEIQGLRKAILQLKASSKGGAAPQSVELPKKSRGKDDMRAMMHHSMGQRGFDLDFSDDEE